MNVDVFDFTGIINGGCIESFRLLIKNYFTFYTINAMQNVLRSIKKIFCFFSYGTSMFVDNFKALSIKFEGL